jgi:hypothetical protein
MSSPNIVQPDEAKPATISARRMFAAPPLKTFLG